MTLDLGKAPWGPHVYLMRCVVNVALRPVLAPLRSPWPNEPEWMSDVRRDLASPELPEWWEALSVQPFVKIGSTYQQNPSTRTRALAEPASPSTTMTCQGVPVVGRRVLCYIPGEWALERALHVRWRSDRIDHDREFFWVNDEMRDLAAAWQGRDPMGEADPFLAPAGRVTWWGERALTNGEALGWAPGGASGW